MPNSVQRASVLRYAAPPRLPTVVGSSWFQVLVLSAVASKEDKQIGGAAISADHKTLTTRSVSVVANNTPLTAPFTLNVKTLCVDLQVRLRS